MLVILLTFSLYLCVCSGQVLQFGTCADVESMKYFQMEKFLGTWHVVQRFPTWYEDYGHCAYKTFEYCGRRMEMTHSYIRDGIEYVLHVNTTYAPGDEAVFSIPENNIDPIGIPLIVIDTDYNSYALIYGCKSNENLQLKYLSSWILSRTPSLDDEVLSNARRTLVERTSSSAVYLETIHHNRELCTSHWTAHVYAKYYVNTTDVDDLE